MCPSIPFEQAVAKNLVSIAVSSLRRPQCPRSTIRATLIGEVKHSLPVSLIYDTPGWKRGRRHILEMLAGERLK